MDNIYAMDVTEVGHLTLWDGQNKTVLQLRANIHTLLVTVLAESTLELTDIMDTIKYLLMQVESNEIDHL